MSAAIGTRNPSLKLPPEWATPEGRHQGDFFSSFQNALGEQWAFMLRGTVMRLAGSGLDWETKTKSTDFYAAIPQLETIDLVAGAGINFGLELHLAERLWLAGCILEAVEMIKARLPKSSAGKPCDRG